MEENNEISKTNRIKIIVITLLIFIVSIAGISYAYFTIQIQGNDTASSMRLSTADMSLVYNDVQIVSGEYATPGWSDTKTLTVTNTGNVTVEYIIKFRELTNTVINGELVMSATCSASSGSCSNLPERAVHSAPTEITNAHMYGPISIDPGVTHTYTLTVEFIETGSNQNYNQNKYFNGTLNIGDGTATDESCFTTTGEFNGDHSLNSINGYDATCGTDIIIPRTIDGKPVVRVGNNSLKEKGLTSVVIPSTVTSIGNYAFSNNQLTSVVIPSSVTIIGNSAFKNNQLTSVVIPNSVTAIENNAFENNQLTSVVIPSSVTTIGSAAFFNNYLTSVTIPNSVTAIDYSAFMNNRLTSVTIPSSVTTIAGDVFRSNQLTSVVIPNSVETIGNRAFHTNQLTSVTIPSSVMTIGTQAFYGNQLKSVTIEGKTSSSEFTTYGDGGIIWGWASAANRTCTVTNNTSNVEGGCITWTGSGS